MAADSNVCGCCYLSLSEVCDAEYREEYMRDVDEAARSIRPSPSRKSAASAVRAPAVVRSGWATFSFDWWWGFACALMSVAVADAFWLWVLP